MDASGSTSDRQSNHPVRQHPSTSNTPAIVGTGTESARTSIESRIPPIQQIDRSRAAFTPSTSSATASPRVSTISQFSPRDISTVLSPGDRALPSRDVNESNIAEAYAAFILYCNPSFPISTDTTELKRLFQSPPRSDGKNFRIWRLLELLQKFDQKEIKTWSQLVLDLGVERPSAEKGQSTQKVQQYSVRLKRWLRAMHVDAFFEFLMGKNHPYFVQIPSTQIPSPEVSRDGVPFEEDMAIKALNPSLRPKRGRRKNEEGDEKASSENSPRPKRSQLDTSSILDDPNSLQPQYEHPRSALPLSAHPGPDSRLGDEDQPWERAGTSRSAIEPSGVPLSSGPSMSSQMNRHLSWRLQGAGDEPATPHPLSAITPRATPFLEEAFDEPQSALTPSTRGRNRRKHGPAVSSAWHSTGGSSTGKLRGRPPTNRAVQDGPYVTFPANPNVKGKGLSESFTPQGMPMYVLPPIEEKEDRHFRFPPESPSAYASAGPEAERHHDYRQQQSIQTRPERLQLQVPQRTGGPVHLMAPTLLVNDQREDLGNVSRNASLDSQSVSSIGYREGRSNSRRRGRSRERKSSSATRRPSEAPSLTGARSPIPSDSDMKRALTADLLRADITGRKRLNGPEAKMLAEVILQQLRSSQSLANANDDIRRVMCISWLGMTQLLAIDQGPVGGGKKIAVHQYRIDRDGYEIPVDQTQSGDDDDEDNSADDNDDNDDDDDDGGSADLSRRKGRREMFDVSWTLLLGGLSGEFQLKGLKLPRTSRDNPTSEGNLAGESTAAELLTIGQEDWRNKWAAMQEALKAKEQELQQLRDQVINAVL